MTVEQVALSLIVAVLTAFATSVINNWFELRRLQAMWKRETNERIGNYRRERLQERLAFIEHYLAMLLGSLQPEPTYSMIGREKLEKVTSDLAYAMNMVVACARAVGDAQLSAAIKDLDLLSDEASVLVSEHKVSSEHTEWDDLSARVLAAAEKALKRMDDLPVQAYAHSVREE